MLKGIWMFDRITNIRQENVRIFDAVVLHTYYTCDELKQRWYVVYNKCRGFYAPNLVIVGGVRMPLHAYASTPFPNA